MALLMILVALAVLAIAATIRHLVTDGGRPRPPTSHYEDPMFRAPRDRIWPSTRPTPWATLSEPTTGLLLLRHGGGAAPQVHVTWPARPAPESPTAVVAGPPQAVAHVSRLLGEAGLLTLAIETDSPDHSAVAEVTSWLAAHADELAADRSFVVVGLHSTTTKETLR